MKDERKTKKQLIAELEEIRQQRSVDRAEDDIREAVLAMRQAEDLRRVISTIRHSMEAVGFDIIVCSICFLDDSKELTHLYAAHVSPRKFDISWTSCGSIRIASPRCNVTFSPPTTASTTPCTITKISCMSSW